MIKINLYFYLTTCLRKSIHARHSIYTVLLTLMFKEGKTQQM